ncbi:hypothetical protein ADL01_07910 [Streptomyces sp. NRRL WC-3618]|nr:hypothetical protein ADL01_07910 [Streptomyces sp. NRRL WC-3618]
MTADRLGSGRVVLWSKVLVVQVLFAQQVVLATARGLLLALLRALLLPLLARRLARLGVRGVSGALVLLRFAALARLLALVLRTAHDGDSF